MRALPNALAVLRALAVAPVVLFVLVDRPESAGVALAVFAVAAATDAIDGPLARRLRAVSPLGAFLDPLADKVLVLGTLLALLARGVVDPLPVDLILAREAAVTTVRAIAAGRGVSVSASAYGKVKATLQAGAVGGQLLALAFPALALDAAADAVLAAAAAATLVTGADVVWRGAVLLGASTRRHGAVRADAR